MRQSVRVYLPASSFLYLLGRQKTKTYNRRDLQMVTHSYDERMPVLLGGSVR